jgi:tight adherence protein C
MAYLVALLVTMSVALLVFAVAGIAPARAYEVRRKLASFRIPGSRPVEERSDRRERVEALIEEMGEKILPRGSDRSERRARLVRAGYYSPGAVPLYYGARLLMTIGFATVLFLMGSLRGLSPALAILMGATGAGIGWLLPQIFLSRKTRARQKDMQKALPDALDLMVTCVEAGLGLNQALVRVSEEIGYVSHVMGDEMRLVNLEIRAGTPRAEALRHLGERTGLADLRTLTAMLVQTDRFGTSIARALRVHSDTMRIKRRQRAEEAAAKTTIKLVFPLVLFIFPAMFVVILGPAMLHILKTLRSLG